MSQRASDSDSELNLLSLHPGEIAGGLAVLTGEPSSFTIKAKHTSKVALINRNSFYE